MTYTNETRRANPLLANTPLSFEPLPNQEQDQILDRKAALASVGGDAELLLDLGTLFLQEYPVMLEELRSAVAKRDSDEIERAAHGLKGAVSMFGSGLAYQAALKLELQGRSGDLRHVERDLADLERFFVQLCEDIQKLILE